MGDSRLARSCAVAEIPLIGRNPPVCVEGPGGIEGDRLADGHAMIAARYRNRRGIDEDVCFGFAPVARQSRAVIDCQSCEIAAGLVETAADGWAVERDPVIETPRHVLDRKVARL